MSFGSTTQHHAKRYHGWDTPDDYQVYETTVVEAAPPMPAARFTDHHHGRPPYHPNVPVEYNNDYDYDYEERVVEAPRARVVEYEYVATQHVKPAPHHHVHVQNVDREADDFIKLEHKKFELHRLMSSRSL